MCTDKLLYDGYQTKIFEVLWNKNDITILFEFKV